MFCPCVSIDSKYTQADVYLTEDGAGQELVLQELWRQSVDMNSVQEGVQVLGSALHVPADPVCTGLVHLTWTYSETKQHVGFFIKMHFSKFRNFP